MNFGAFINGDLRKMAEEEVASIQKASRTAVTAGGTKSQTVLRGQVESAGLGPKVAKAWRLTVYPKGSRRADNPAAMVKSAAPRIVTAFDAGLTITARNAQWLLIPLQAAIDAGVDRMQGRPGSSTRRGLSKWSDEDAATRRFGDLRFVPLQGGAKALLVADVGVTNGKNGQRFRKLGQRNTRRGAAVPVFLLVRRVSEKKLLDVDAGAKAGLDEMYATYVAALNAGG